MTHEQYEVLRASLQTEGERFGHYQQIPAFVRARLPAAFGEYGSRQLELDAPRYRFLDAHLPLEGLSVLEVGASLGYFGLSLAHDHGCRYVGYEPITAYAAAASLLSEAAGVAHLCRFHASAVALADIPSLPSADLIIELNVLHHGGSVFDADAARRLGGWEQYAVERLRRFRVKGRYLFFQTGNVADSASLFPTEDALSTVAGLLSRAGWRTRVVGVIADLHALDYVTLAPDETATTRTYSCRRNPATGLVDYYLSGRLVGSLMTGLANRPLWVCE